MAIREGRWDCPQCGYVGNLGRDVVCRGCGKPRDEDVEFYLPEDAPEVTDEQMLTDAKAGPDWLCPYCGDSNRAHWTTCKGCGAPREGAEVRETGLVSEKKKKKAAKKPRREPPPAPAAKGGMGKFAIIGAVGVVLLIICLAFAMCSSREAQLTVAGFEWERTIEIERLNTLTEEGWEGELPADADILSSERAIHHYDQVIDHYETKSRQVEERVKVGEYVCDQKDLGNGYFEDVYCDKYETRYRTEEYEAPVYRDEPVYKTKYTYEIDRWQRERVERASGTDKMPEWPEVNLKNKEREGERTEKYIVHFADDEGETYPYKTNYEEWREFTEGEMYNAQINRMTSEVTEVER